MISKIKFIEIIDRLKQTNDFVEETNEKARKLQDVIESDFFNANSLSISHESIVVDLLENMFKTDLISWWIYEKNYGRNFKLGDFEDSGNKIDLSNSSKLYDYLFQCLEEEKKENRKIITEVEDWRII